MDCMTLGSRKPRDFAIDRLSGVIVIFANGGEFVCKAWPILLIALALGLMSSPVEEKAPTTSVN